MDSPGFELRESREDGWQRLTLLGELDMASAADLERRLRELRESGASILLDLSQLGFMDSSGLRVVIKSIRQASGEGWRFRIHPDIAPQPRRIFELTGLHRFVTGPDSASA